MITMSKLALLMLSYLGYWEFFRARCKMNVYYVPVFTLSCHFVILFAAGILNYLKDATVLLLVAGFILLINSFHKNKLKLVKPYLRSGYLFFVAAFFVVMWCTHGRVFSQIDNFTHWATVVKNMLHTDRFPNWLDTAVSYTSYPLGSSAIIYYFCKLVGESEHILMWAQAFIMLCAILPVFAFAKRHVAVNTLLIAIMTGFLFRYNIPITELLVDTLMPLVGVATIAFVYYQYIYLGENAKLPVYYALPMMLWTMNIKHSAILYTIVAVLLLFVSTQKDKLGRKQLWYSVAILFAAKSLWDRHCSYIDPEVTVSQHALSINWFRKIVGEKTVTDILGIIQEFFEYLIFRRELLWLAAWMILLIALTFLLSEKQKHLCLRHIACIAIMSSVYATGVLGMYIFSMPVSDGLVAVDRYMKSGDVAIYYLMLLLAVSILSEVEDKGQLASAAILLTLAVAGWWFQTGEYANTDLVTCTAEERQRWEEPIAEYGIVKRKSYLLCIRQEDDLQRNYLPQNVWKYNMESSAVTQVVVTEESQLVNEKRYDYVIILDEDNPVIRQWLQENYPDRINSRVIQHFG